MAQSLVLTPTATQNAAWTGSTTLSNYTTDDGDSTFIANTTGVGTRANFLVSDVSSSTIQDGSTITSVELFIHARGNGGNGSILYTVHKPSTSSVSDTGAFTILSDTVYSAYSNVW